MASQSPGFERIGKPATWAIALAFAISVMSTPILADQSASRSSEAEDNSFQEAFAEFSPADGSIASEPDAWLDPEAPEAEVIAVGIASYYGKRFAGRPTASGEIFDPEELTAAHRSLPFGSKVLVTNSRNGRSVIVRINDRGPFHGKRLIDLSREAARRIGLIGPGRGSVELALLTS